MIYNRIFLTTFLRTIRTLKSCHDTHIYPQTPVPPPNIVFTHTHTHTHTHRGRYGNLVPPHACLLSTLAFNLCYFDCIPERLLPYLEIPPSALRIGQTGSSIFFFYILLTVHLNGTEFQPDPARKLSAKPVWHIPLLCIQ